MFKGAISWICSLLLLCGLTTGLLVLLFIALDPQLAGGLGEAFINLTYGEYPRWLPVAAISVILFVAALLALLFAFRKDRHDFENMLAAWLAKIWVEVKLLVIVAVVLVAILLDFGTTLGGMITPVVAVVFLYFLCLDIGKNRQFFRHNIVHSLLKALNSYRDLTGFEQRSLRRLLSTLAVIVGVLGVSAATFLSLLRVAQSPIRDFFLLGVVGFAAAGVIGSIFWYTLALKRDLRDWSVLLAQIAEMYGGNLNAVNHIPPTSNLYDCAMQLNMIRTGIQKAVEEGIKADRTKVELITNVSHDIKTPLTSIVNYVDLLKKEDIPSPIAREYIAVLDRQSKRLKKLTEDLVEASKASSGALPVDLQPTDVNVLFSQIVGEYQDRLADCHLTLVAQPPEGQPVVAADSKLLSRVMDNLVSNICKYAMPETRVYVSGTVADGQMTLSFKNVSRAELNISPDELMERFVRGDASRHTEGSGLGLSIAQSLVQLMGGTFRLSIDADLFRADVTLPLVQQS